MAQPNVIIIMTDQQRADLSRREGFPLDTTPFSDALAARGTWFDRAYTSMPTCAPARVSMLTGRYPSATHVRTNHNIQDAFYTRDLFDVFRGLGYTTAMCGKNHSHLTPERVDWWYECGHLGIDDPDRTADERAFDDFLREKTHFHMWPEATPFPVECQIPYRLVSRAQGWVDSVKDQPFLLWLSFPEPHNPYQVPEPYYSMFAPDGRRGEAFADGHASDHAPGCECFAPTEKGFKYQFCRESFIKAFPDYEEQIPRARSNYLGMLRLLDDQIQRFTGFLEEKGLLENTILVVLSDHGDFVGEYGLLRKGPELPEPLVRIPLSFTGPGIQSSDESHAAHVSIADVMPTLCEAVGAPLPDGAQGRSLWPMLTGQPYPEAEFASVYSEHGFGGLYYTEQDDLDPASDGLTASRDGQWGAFDCLNSRTQCGQMRMVRKGHWKLTFDMEGTGRLYDLSSDPRELTDLYRQPETAEKCRELLEDMLTWRLRVEDPLPLPRQRYVMKKGD